MCGLLYSEFVIFVFLKKIPKLQILVANKNINFAHNTQLIRIAIAGLFIYYTSLIVSSIYVCSFRSISRVSATHDEEASAKSAATEANAGAPTMYSPYCDK